MFEFIKNLFKKDVKNEAKLAVSPKNEELDRKTTEDLPTLEELGEEIRVLQQRTQELRRKRDEVLRELGFVYRFRDTRTGEIHKVTPGDDETYRKLLHDKDMEIYFG